jgi:PAS domain S-box-containing protein
MDDGWVFEDGQEAASATPPFAIFASSLVGKKDRFWRPASGVALSDKKRAFESRKDIQETTSRRKGTRETTLAHRDTMEAQRPNPASEPVPSGAPSGNGAPALDDLFRTTLSTISDGIIACDLKGIVTFLNPAAEILTGWNEKDACGSPVEKVCPLLREKNRETVNIHEVSSFGEKALVDWRGHKSLIAKDGTERLIDAEIKPIRDERGEIGGLALVFRDLTERRRSAQHLWQSEERYRLLVETAPIGIFVNQHGRFGYANQKLLHILGASRPEEILGQPVLQRVSSAYQQTFRDRIRSVLDRGQALPPSEENWVRLDGTPVQVEVSATPCVYDGVPAIQVLVQEMSERKRAQEARSQLATIVESSGDAIFSKSLDGTVTSWNPGAERLFGYRAEEVVGKPVAILLASNHIEELLESLRKVEKGDQVPPFETVSRRKDGKSVDVSVSISPIRDEQERIVGASAIARDISQRKNLELQVRQSQKMEAIGQLAGGIAHDFNNLLTIITGYSEMLLTRLPVGDLSRESIGEIRKSAERAASLTRQLLAFGRKQVLAPVVLDLNEVVQEMEKMLRRLIGEDIELTTVLDSKLDLVKADPGQIEQVIMNLAVNARDAMPVGGKLVIETANVDLDELYIEAHSEARPGPYVTLAVSDTGCGMDERTQARIFEPFFTTKGPGKGTGLGLATVYGIVKQSGGYIFVDSELGNGTTFKIFLPPVPKEKAIKKQRISSFKAPRGTETLLLVEDEDAVRSLAGHALQSYGYNVLVASQGMEAIRLVENHQGTIHLLITDVVMPQLGGRQLVDKLQHLQAGMKVLYLSGYTDDAVVRHGLMEGEAAFLQKPFPPVVLAHKVREILDQ